ncbi:SMI1/KNR4 family protein [Hahella sp. CR1]|uniref:SMI1/KNR4 family protein n=1 Tax=Hahella sp. CR1 TaxID=2992807 RepID=UPI002443134F|nr:SMI1/KNR4 family protein [Hahella sp. CR1]MDG9671177.1 SMI1/KNR4 family protein [Hahella sp. CR1]
MIENFKKQLDKNLKDLIKLSLIPGYSGIGAKELCKVEEHAGGPLPHIYKEFLITCGKEPSVYFKEASIDLYPDLLELKDVFEEANSEAENPVTLESDVFLIGEYSGEQFWYFKMSDGSDPAVYFLSIWDNHTYKEDDHLSNFLLSISGVRA